MNRHVPCIRVDMWLCCNGVIPNSQSWIYIYPDQRIKWFDVICRWWFDYVYIYDVVCIFGVPNFIRNRSVMISIRITNVIIAIRGVREWAERLRNEWIISSINIVFHVVFLDFDYCIIIIHLFHRTGLISEMSSSRWFMFV